MWEMEDVMLVIVVEVRVTEDARQAFVEATRSNAEASRRETLVVQFDLWEDPADRTRFRLLEVYRSEAGATLHKQTAHYASWRDAVAPMMAEPRRSTRWTSVDHAYPAS
jgi:(4S)-4-hydroxy-5-phosphonooxypentane-2,3-dione isomerase